MTLRPHPPPYQQTDPLPGDRWDSVYPTRSENDPLLGRYCPHNTGPVPDSSGVKKQHSFKIFVILSILSILFIGAFIDRSYNYNAYERLWRKWAAEEEHRASIRTQWVEELEQHEVLRISMEEERAKWKEETAARDAERQRREKQRADLLWTDVNAGHCLRYGYRGYEATLSNVAVGMDGMAECANKTLSIYGRDVLPTSCQTEFEGTCGHVMGHWIIADEACSPRWDALSDKGCDVRVHKRRYDAHLMNVQNMNDWEILCKTTPTVINGVLYEGAMSCVNSMWGVFGIWNIEDVNCSQ